MKNIYFVILSCLIIFYIINSVRKSKLDIKTSFKWVISSIIMLILAIFPYSLDWLARLLGINYPPALFLTLCIVFLIVQNFNFSKQIESQHEKIIVLAQEISIIKNEIKRGR